MKFRIKELYISWHGKEWGAYSNIGIKFFAAFKRKIVFFSEIKMESIFSGLEKLNLKSMTNIWSLRWQMYGVCAENCMGFTPI